MIPFKLQTYFVVSLMITLLYFNTVVAQSQFNDSNLNVIEVYSYGEALNEQDAIKEALRQAIESALGAYLVSSTYVKDSQLLTDEIMSMSYGNIEKYTIINSKHKENSVMVELKVLLNKTKLNSIFNKIFSANDIHKDSYQLSEKVKNKIDQVKKAERIIGFLSEKIQFNGYIPYIHTYQILDVDSSGINVQLNLKFKLDQHLWGAYFDALNYSSIGIEKTGKSDLFEGSRDGKFFCKSSSDDYIYVVYESIRNKCLERTHLKDVTIGDRYVNIGDGGYSVFLNNIYSHRDGLIQSIPIRIKLNSAEEIDLLLKINPKVRIVKTFYQYL